MNFSPNVHYYRVRPKSLQRDDPYAIFLFIILIYMMLIVGYVLFGM